ncbi:MAG: signal peptide peptidase SppA [Myxococcales bacterium]|jgi:protease-4
MRLLFALVYDLFVLVFVLLALPLRLVARGGPAYLAVDVTRDIPWRSEPRSWWRGKRAARRPASLKTLADKLELAVKDRRIRGVVFKVEGFEGSGAKLAEIRRMVRSLREKGKDVVFYGRAVTTREYALMASGSRVWMAPGGRVDLRGFSASLYVLGETLERFGIRAQFLRRGSHKTAPELFTDREVSEAQRETVGHILADAMDTSVEAIAQGRNRPAEEVRRLIDEGPYTASRALAAGLIDAIGDGDDLKKALAEGKEKKARLIPIAHYQGSSPFRARYRRLLPPPAIGVVRIDGVIKLGESFDAPWAPRAAGSDTVARSLERAREDHRIKALVLHIDSRGGSSLASELMLKAVKRVAEKKPVVTFVDRVAASGGYMAALGGTHFVIAPNAITGSIGVFSGKFEISRLLEWLGVGTAVLRMGANSAIESPFEPWSEAERATLDKEIEETYRDFLRSVAEGRRMPVEKVEPLAEGRVYTGRRAQALGLADELGGFEEAVRKAAELAGLRKKPAVVAIGVPSRSLRALTGPKATEVFEALRPLEAERVFAHAGWWPHLEPEP